ncbi:PREDICTED: transmembrane protein 198 [Drosophila arizonae]|uniref:Transmembrane protein 198 n=1 Tax=Drosophila arizonae TaxID=7263 RepID=A0ABM1PUM9_DROAR|nr:PREDICTED: transmembrane protein 198 [Drosophila arizonae]
MSETAGNASGVGAAGAPAAAALHSLDSYDVIYDAGQEHSDDMQSVSHMDWPFLIKGILENSQTCAPTTPETLPALLWAIIAVFGIVYALLGYRCLRAVGFLSGLMVGANGIFILQDFQITWLGKPADSALAIVAGLLGAVLGSTYPVASVLISAFAGALLSGAAMAVCVATMPDNEFGYREIYVAVVGGAVICSVLTLCCVKYVTILTSSIVGTAMVIGAIDYFMHSLETINWILSMKPHPLPPPCYGGLLITAWPLTIVISIMVQCFITAWRVDHRKRLYMRHHPQHPHGNHHLPHGQPAAGAAGVGNPHVPMRRSQSRTRETREEARQRKFRYLYQVRTARGDIISQNFVSALQKRIQLSGTETPSERSIKTSSNERNTFRSDRTHFTTIHDPELCDKIEIVRDIG